MSIPPAPHHPSSFVLPSASAIVRAGRLSGGLVLMLFVAMHLSTLAFGLSSLAAIERAQGWLLQPWRSAPGSLLLMAAACVHLATALYATASRRCLMVRRSDTVQIALGLAIVPLLVGHILSVKAAPAIAANLSVGYGELLAVFWHFAPTAAIQQLIVVVVVWTHGAIGTVHWMSLQRWWPRVGPVLLPVFFAVPILALLGFVEAGKEVLDRLVNDPVFRAQMTEAWQIGQGVQPELQAIRTATLTSYAVAVAMVAAVLVLRVWQARRRPVTVTYDGGLAGEGGFGQSILEISRVSGVPHASVCSGRGRCGTCRVRVEDGDGALSIMDDVERRTLGVRTGSSAIRLACRARVFGDGVRVERLMPPDADASAARRPQDWMGGAHLAPAPSPAEPVLREPAE